MRDRPTTLRARALRQNSTVAERILWERLRASRFNNWKFRRQSGIGGYVADFLCHDPKLVVELDGAVHDGEQQAAFDKKRDAEIEALGFSVVRLDERMIREEIELALAAIDFTGNRVLRGLSPFPGEDELD